jgi:cysteine desulfurase
MRQPAPIYLDHAAATPLAAEVEAAIATAQALAFANPSSQHAAGRTARRLLEDARDRIMAAVGGRGTGSHRDRLVFTSGSSEANHLAIVGLTTGLGGSGTLFSSCRDHASIVHAVRAAAHGGWRAETLPLDMAGRLDPRVLSARLAEVGRDGPAVVTLTTVCGQTGVIEAVVGPPAGGSTLLHVDATQSAGFLPVDFAASAAATLALAPHKFGGPRGIGALVVRGGVPLEPVLAGTQEHGLRGGTEAVPLAVGFARAMELAAADRESAAARVAALRDRFEERIMAVARQAGIAAVRIGAGGPRGPHIATIAFPGLDRQSLAMAADLAGVCLATGTACASGSSEPAPALVAMGLPPEVVRGAVRFSFGRSTTVEEIDLAVARLAPLMTRGA